MAPNPRDENDAISLDEEELRRLLEQPIADDEAGATDAGEMDADEAEAGAADATWPAAGEDAIGSLATGMQTPVSQEAIDRMLAQVGAASTATTAPADAGVPRAAKAVAPAKREAARAATQADPAPPPGRAPVTVQPVQFAPIGAAATQRDRTLLGDLGILLDVPLQITVELGRTEMPVREILSLGPGSVIELDRSAGEVLDVFVNGTLLAQGEVVVVDEQFGIRLTRVFSPSKDLLDGMGA